MGHARLNLLPQLGQFLKLRAGLRGLMVASALLVMGIGATAVARSQFGPRTVAPVAEKLIPAVVNISTSQVARGPQGVPLPNVPQGAPFEEFFEEFFQGNGKNRDIPRKVSSLGSGFVIDGKQGLIVTNNHVIADADEIVVNFHDGSRLEVDKVLGTDAKTDLALLKVTPKSPLADVKFGKSGDLRVGDWVMAIGNPFGLGGSVSVGIISAKQRDINSGPYDDYLQTDAAINKGNSGGPLFNMDGEVIGINTAIISPTGGSIGIGFAVPSDTAFGVIEQLRLYGETRRGWLGVNIQSVSDDIAATLGVSDTSGALVSSVTPDSPAAKAGLVAGDLIRSFDGKPIKTMRVLPRVVAQTEVGKVVDVDVLRSGKSLTLRVTVGRLPEDEKASVTAPPPAKKDDRKKGAEKSDEVVALGLTLRTLSEELRGRYQVQKDVEGVLITAVKPGSAAARKNISAGDVIVKAASQKTEVPGDVLSSIKKIRDSLRRKAIMLEIIDRGGNLRFEALPIE